MRTVLITGSNRGIGLALAHQLAAQGDRVFATCRRPEQATELRALAHRYPDQVHIVALDVTDEASLQQAFHVIARMTPALDWLINNAGVLVEGESLRTLDFATVMRVFDVNTLGPFRVVQRFLPLLQGSKQPLICQMTSIMGSIELTEGPGYYSYRGSKAALNMMSKVLAHELRPLGIPVILMHPGWVRTDMGGPQAPLRPEDSARGILRVLSGVTLRDTGRFLTWEGRELPW